LSYRPDEPGFPGNPYPLEPFDASFALPPRPPKFQSRLWLHGLLFLMTLASTTIAGAFHYASFLSEFEAQPPAFHWGLLFQGFWYSGTLLGILGAHEMGHYLLCRRYNVDASLPYFIPMPPLLFLTGTLGAVIKIREPFPNRTVLFDIGVAGPIAGFLLLVPALFYGMTISNVVPAPTQGSILFLGEPLLFQWAMRAVFGTIRDGYTVNMHPMVFAAWFGMIATALNLLPFGQLDGGHVAYAVFGRKAWVVSLVTLSVTLLLSVLSRAYFLTAIIMLVMAYFLGLRHPVVPDSEAPLDPTRKAIAVLVLLMFILCFTPVPIVSIFGQ